MPAHPKPLRDHDTEFQAEIRKLPCIGCNAPPPSTVSHIKTRGSGGGDSAWNLLPKCLDCHMYWEADKHRFLHEHPHVWELMQSLGWEKHGKRIWHPLANY